MRLRQVEPEYEGRVRVRTRPFALELYGRQAAPRALLAEEWWLAAIQEPAAEFNAFEGDDWPTTTLPAFVAVRAAEEQDARLADALDLRIRRAFFAESRNIGKPEVLLELVRELGGDVAQVAHALDGGGVRVQIEREFEIARQQFGVRGTPTLMLEDGTQLEMPIAKPRIVGGRIVGIRELTCVGESCRAATRALFERALVQRRPDEGSTR
ncbi:MAG: DsbA family protein [Gemmatimonadota bacterium]|nr:DsbA family protein [Gemmatimonadota bacterium]